MIWPFRKRTSKTPKPRDDRGWNEDWQVGDIAECIKSGWVGYLCGEKRKGPKIGDRNAVERISDAVLPSLSFKRYPDQTFTACSFRKIRPQADAIERAETSDFHDWLSAKEPSE